MQALGAQVDWDVRSGDRALTILHSNNGKKLAKKGAKDCPPAAAARAGIASPACSSNMASYSACGAREGAGAPRPALGLYSSQSCSATGCRGFWGCPNFTDRFAARMSFQEPRPSIYHCQCCPMACLSPLNTSPPNWDEGGTFLVVTNFSYQPWLLQAKLRALSTAGPD